MAASPAAPYAAEVRLGRNEKVFVGFDGHPWRRDGGFAADCWTDSDFTTAWDDSVRQPELANGAITLFTGGAPARDLGDAAAFADAGIAALEPAFPGLLAGRNGRTGRTTWGATRGIEGAYSSFAPGQITRFASLFWIEDAGEAIQEVASGRLAFAGENFSEAFGGYMNGGAQTGRLAAHTLARTLAG